ncbi:hypothetical protein CLOBOL_02170 [Enterocloster bolteae ATCC BAA-613]|uniref:Uncharacterized protein n=1 Tax=Enterocloster bolteae (strain ATCC BAA-613 / DSM 15670 / CCUG 46953 / JCM 12243 / WAL 16351) TaxID=411902 RepID=A8RND5_ENTBW|nr:hypothetical protein CLOBOL_02170 [Enterocloster bolteae ATCC BAA-613]
MSSVLRISLKCDLALVRLSMWCCCAADLSPMSFLMDSEVTFKED